MRKNGQIPAHFHKAFPDQRGAAENKRVNKTISGRTFPDKEKQKKNSGSPQHDQLFLAFYAAKK